MSYPHIECTLKPSNFNVSKSFLVYDYEDFNVAHSDFKQNMHNVLQPYHNGDKSEHSHVPDGTEHRRDHTCYSRESETPTMDLTALATFTMPRVEASFNYI